MSKSDARSVPLVQVELVERANNEMLKFVRFLAPVVLFVAGGYLASQSDFGPRFSAVLVCLGIGLTICFVLLVVDAGTTKSFRWTITKGEFAAWASASQTLSLINLIAVSDLDIQVMSVLPVFPIAFGFSFLCISLFVFLLKKMLHALRTISRSDE